jgi:hypothetical protein
MTEMEKNDDGAGTKYRLSVVMIQAFRKEELLY